MVSSDFKMFIILNSIILFGTIVSLSISGSDLTQAKSYPYYSVCSITDVTFGSSSGVVTATLIVDPPRIVQLRTFPFIDGNECWINNEQILLSSNPKSSPIITISILTPTGFLSLCALLHAIYQSKRTYTYIFEE